MYILALETTGPVGSAAVIDGQGSVSMRVSAEEMNHLKDLMPMAKRLMEELHICPRDLSAVAASVGPGSFTGIRIGVASARALAQALDIPAIAVPTLDSFKLMCGGRSLIVPIFNARRGQVYGGIFDTEGGDILKSGPYMLEDVLATTAEYLKRHPENDVTFYGDGVDAYAEKLDNFSETMHTCRVFAADKLKRYQNAAMTARVALEKFRLRDTVAADELLPDYMRVTEAEQKLKDGRLAEERAAKMARFKTR